MKHVPLGRRASLQQGKTCFLPPTLSPPFYQVQVQWTPWAPAIWLPASHGGGLMPAAGSNLQRLGWELLAEVWQPTCYAHTCLCFRGSQTHRGVKVLRVPHPLLNVSSWTSKHSASAALESRCQGLFIGQVGNPSEIKELPSSASKTTYFQSTLRRESPSPSMANSKIK